MNPEVWGPHAWFFLHTITMNYPNKPTIKDKEDNKNFIKYFGRIIPCEKCKKNFEKHLKELPLTDKVLKNKKSFIKWMVEMQNKVNVINNKSIMSVDDHLTNFTKKYSNNNKNSNYLYLFLLVILVIILVFLYKHYY